MSAAQQPPIGIVVNPMSGKDVRRLVARASVFDNREKSAIVRRAIEGAMQAGALHFAFMDDSHNIAGSAMADLPADITATRIPGAGTATAYDTEDAARALRKMGAAATLVLGGDGTARAFAKGWRQAVMLPLSTGTNNVFPRICEATVAGAALGLLAAGKAGAADVTDSVKIIDIDVDGESPDIALIDAVISADRFIGARALLDADVLQTVLLTRADPGAVGMASVGGLLQPVSATHSAGLLLHIGDGESSSSVTVNAPIAPGYYRRVTIAGRRLVAPGETLRFSGPCVLALDGERERVVKSGQVFTMTLSRTGPAIIDIDKTMQAAACSGAFIDNRG